MLGERLIRLASNEADSSQLTANSTKQKRGLEVASLQNNGRTEVIHSKAGQAPPLQD
jgi:hypothetical protein